ncbi:MAG: group 1 truncated hemoglobin [candidate division Zixibacteria bacterium]|nr:group 1 truncated hemoglobin [candidate division Zixibacteria bacterium]
MRRKIFNLSVFSLVAVLAGSALSPLTALAQEDSTVQTQEDSTTPAQTPSLYDRLGGVYSIATVVDDFVERLLVNDVLNANPKIDAARDHVPKAGLKFRVTALICQLAGGPEVYHGRSMTDAHAHLGITEKEWDAMVADFVLSLNKFNVPEKEQGELFALVGPTKDQIVTK